MSDRKARRHVAPKVSMIAPQRRERGCLNIPTKPANIPTKATARQMNARIVTTTLFKMGKQSHPIESGNELRYKLARSIRGATPMH